MAVAALVPLVGVPACIAVLLKIYDASIGDLTLKVVPGRERAVDWHWIFPLSGITAAATYLCCAVIAAVALRKASSLARNRVIIILVPVSLVLFYVLVMGRK